MGRALVRDFHTRCLYQKSYPLAALACSISDASPTRAKIPYTRPAHEVISISAIILQRETFAPGAKCSCLYCLETMFFGAGAGVENKQAIIFEGDSFQDTCNIYIYSVYLPSFLKKLCKPHNFFPVII